MFVTTSSVTSLIWLRLRSRLSSSNLSLRGLLVFNAGDMVTDFRVVYNLYLTAAQTAKCQRNE